MTLELVLARTGEVLDTVVIDGERVAFRTGRARDVIGRHDVRTMIGWTNGYLILRRVD